MRDEETFVQSNTLSAAELGYVARIRSVDVDLRTYMENHSLFETPDPRQWFEYLTGIKGILGNLNNSIGFLATLLAKRYLDDRFHIRRFDAAEKAQGAPGPDIEVRTAEGMLIRAEIKTTRPYQPGFGANQKNEIRKDLKKLVESLADHKLMLVTDPDAFKALCRPVFEPHAQGVEIVNLLTGETFHHR